MADVSVTPTEFTMVKFDAARIAELVSDLSDRLGFPSDLPIAIEIDEKTPLNRNRIVSTDPVALFIEGGAIEEPTVPRTMSERAVIDVAGRLLLRVRDRLGDFADVAEESALSLQQQTAWDAYCMGRLERLGYEVKKPRRQYHFRNRHGFTDAADAVFERLWSSDSLTWADIDAACEETSKVRVPS